MRIGAFSILVWNQLGFLFLFIDLLFEQVYLKMLVIVFSFNSFLEFHTLLLSFSSAGVCNASRIQFVLANIVPVEIIKFYRGAACIGQINVGGNNLCSLVENYH